jgi:hypothetical protein
MTRTPLPVTVAAVVGALALGAVGGAIFAGRTSAPAPLLDRHAMCRSALMTRQHQAVTDEDVNLAEVIQIEPTILACGTDLPGMTGWYFEVRCNDPYKAACLRALTSDELNRLVAKAKGAKP